MKKLALTLSAVFIISLTAAACNTDELSANVSNAIAYALDGNVKGEVGKTYGTKWFEFTVKSIDKIDSYAGYEPEDGYVLYDVLIFEKATFDDDNYMGTYDFYMDADNFEEYVYPYDPIDSTMMPVEFILKKGETAEYHMIYEVPADSTALKLCYTELDEDDNVGALFTINV